MIRGFLRQGLDAERQQKLEAAQWNYQKVLELESDNHFALQRLGIIAANCGNDQDTLRYLQQAFRQNPDDLDTLLAMGFAQVHPRADSAVSSLSRAVSLHPDNVNAPAPWHRPADYGMDAGGEIQLKSLQNEAGRPETAFNLAVLLACRAAACQKAPSGIRPPSKRAARPGTGRGAEATYHHP